MKVKLVGSSIMWTKYNQTSFLIDNNILIDVPNGSLKNLLNINIDIKEIKHYIITHFHADHYFDIPFHLLYNYKNNNNDINLYIDREGKRKIFKLVLLAFPHSIYKIYDNLNIKYVYDNKFIIDNYCIYKFRVKHGKMKSYGYVFDTKNNKVLFTGDTSLSEVLENEINKCNYIFIDCTYKNGNEKHIGIDNIEYLSNKYKDKKFILIHISESVRKYNFKNKNVIIGYDNMDFYIE